MKHEGFGAEEAPSPVRNLLVVANIQMWPLKTEVERSSTWTAQLEGFGAEEAPSRMQILLVVENI